ncbi:MAG: hypothetical protein FWE88_06815 [Phycisphaerae bacterium]|nr:hypothetical protein [Phycisphaerae bacterium]
MNRILAWLCVWSFVLSAGCDGQADRATFRSLQTTVQREAWTGRYANGVILSTEHYRIYTTCTDESLVEFLPGFMEAAHTHYRVLTGVEALSDARIGRMYLLADRQQWADVTRRVTGSRAPRYLAIQAGGYCHKGTCVLWDLGPAQTAAVAAHEGLHQFLTFHLRDGLPMWLEEGLCVSVEGFAVDEKKNVTFDPDFAWTLRRDLRRALERGRWMPLQTLLSMDVASAIREDNEQAVAYYAQLWALVKFLHTHDAWRDGMKQLIADARDGQLRSRLDMSWLEFQLLRADGRRYNDTLSEPLFRAYIADDMADFEQAFEAYARELAGE